jgi:ribosome biogenesis protein Nip4
MAEPKTKKNDASVAEFLAAIEDEKRRADSEVVLKMMKSVTRAEPKMWGSSIVGFGSYHYVYASGREGDWPLVGFSPRKQALTLYLMTGFDHYGELMEKLGKFKTGKGCLYIKKMEDVDTKVLKQLVTESVRYLKKIDRKQ